MAAGKELLTLYEYYCYNGIKSGLSDKQEVFLLNQKEISIYSGAIHYFRVPREYWRDRLRKLRAAGLNTVETYVPWNLHEPQEGYFDFGNGGSDFQEFLDIAEFVNLAKQEDLFVIIRPGPYICAEWEFGGLPSWLLRYDLKIRTSDEQFLNFVKRYFKKLLSILSPLQFTKGGAVIAFQIENEYGNTAIAGQEIDVKYLNSLKEIFLENGIVELLFTSDTPSNGFSGTLPGILATANFQSDAEKELNLLRDFQTNKPLMVMEYWTGWFDHWAEKHHTRSAEEFAKVLEDILKMNASFNLYMFHGGTNWGFLNGANIKDSKSTNNEKFQPDITSYDYDAPLSENGRYTDKYFKLKELIEKYCKVKLKTPEMPELQKVSVYNPIKIEEELTIDNLISQSQSTISSKLISMEQLDINNKSGQSYGYLVYRKSNLNISPNSVLKIENHVSDTVLVLINGKLVSPVLEKLEDLNNFGYYRIENGELNLGDSEYSNATLDLIVENWGRVNYGKLYQFNQYKGLWQGNVLINDKIISDWVLIPLEFKRNCNQNIEDWKKYSGSYVGPAAYRGWFKIGKGEKNDTFLDLRGWTKGFVIVNGFILSRYLKFGPQHTCYVPAPFLREGKNEVITFEHFKSDKVIQFSKEAVFTSN